MRAIYNQAPTLLYKIGLPKQGCVLRQYDIFGDYSIRCFGTNCKGFSKLLVLTNLIGPFVRNIVEMSLGTTPNFPGGSFFPVSTAFHFPVL